MKQEQFHRVTLVLLTLLTILVVLISFTHVTITVFTERLLEAAVYALLTAFAVSLSIPLSKGEISIAYAVGMVAFLSLDTASTGLMTLAMFAGSAIGSLTLREISKRAANRPFVTRGVMVYTTARITLSFFVASRVYLDALGGTLPINDNAAFINNIVPLIAYGLTYVVIYLVIFVAQIEIYIHQARTILEENFISLIAVLMLPVPFTIIAASVARTDVSSFFFAITVIGMALLIFGLYTLSHSQDQMRRQLDEMRSISIATQALRGNLDLDGVLRTAYVQLSQLTHAENFLVALLSEDQSFLHYPLVIRDGEQVLEESVQYQKPDDVGLIDHVMKTATALLIQNAVRDRAQTLNVSPPQDTLKSWLGVPLVIGDQAIGAFVMQSYTRRIFTEDDLRLLNIIVASTSIAVENARLYRQKSLRAEQLATLNQVTSLLTETLSPNEIVDTIVSSASTIVEAEAVAVYLFPEDQQSGLELVQSAGLEETPSPPHPIITERMQTTSELSVKPDTLAIPNIKNAPDVDRDYLNWLQKAQIHAFIETPLVLGGDYLGVLVTYFSQAQVFHDEQLDLIQAFATQAAQSISNARRFASTDRALEQRVAQLYSLAAMGRTLNATMDAQKIYEVILSYATDATNARRGMVALKRDHDRLVVPAQRGYDPAMLKDLNILHEGFTGQVLETGQAFRTNDVRLENGHLPLLPQTRSLIIVPIVKGRDVLGLIMLENDRPGTFSETDSHFVAQIANQAVIAVDNTGLFQRIREARDNLQVILDAMEEGIILVDQDGRIALANPRVDLIELSPADVLGESIENLLQIEALSFAKCVGFASNDALHRLVEQIGHAHAWTQHPPHSYEVHNPELGIRYIQRQIIPVRDASSHVIGALLVFYNKTEERELARARESFSQMIVHDLRSPLTAVTTSLRLLHDIVPEASDFRPVVEKTTSASRRALRKVLARVDSLLDISKMETGEMYLEREPASLAHIAGNVRTELLPLANELEVQIKIAEATDELPLLDVDGDKVERMVLNLVDNALKYSPAHTSVIVQGKVIGEAMLELNVADNGPGIPDEYKRRLFDQFVQVEGRKTVRRGVGLGLTFCKLVVEAHGGDIWIEDNPTGGSIFKATLPIADLPPLPPD